MKKLLVRIQHRILDLYNHIQFKFCKKEDKSIFFFPHPNCKTDNYDIIHYQSDNVLCLINYIIRKPNYNDYTLYIVVYDIEKVSEYKHYVHDVNANANVVFVDYQDKYNIGKYSSRSSYLFTDTAATFFKYRSPRQMVVCLNYYIPFKNDYITDSVLRSKTKKVNSTFDYFILTAYIPSVISALVRSFPLEKFLLLGFCRNDTFYTQTKIIKTRLEETFGFSVKKYIVYTPTYRDYEYESIEEIKRDLFGYNDTDYEALEQILEETQTVIIAKLHPLQNNIRLSEHKTSRIMMFPELQCLGYSLYQYLSESDGLITDYTSTFFDYLHRNRPVIFNWYDFDKYKDTRGFSLNPIGFFSAGEQVRTSQELIIAIERIAKDEDLYKEQREKVASLFDDYYDGNNTQRVCDYFLK